MSFVRILAIKGNTLYQKECHLNQAIRFLDADEEKQIRQLRIINDKRWLDAGYVLIDLDQKIIAQNQSGFSLNHLSRQKQSVLFSRYRIIE